MITTQHTVIDHNSAFQTIEIKAPIGMQSHQVRRAKLKETLDLESHHTHLYPITSNELVTEGSWDPDPNAYPMVPHPAQWGRSISRILFECIIGRRDVNLTRKWLTPHTEKAILSYQEIWDKVEAKTSGGLMKIGSIHLCLPKPGIVELSTAVTISGKIHPTALRMEIKNRCWIITAIETA